MAHPPHERNPVKPRALQIDKRIPYHQNLLRRQPMSSQDICDQCMLGCW